MKKTIPHILCIIGPSASGKTSIGDELEKYGYQHIVGHTTRKPRPGEIEGKTYYYVTLDEFNKIKENNEFVEYRPYSSHWVGTTKQEVLSKLKNTEALYSIVTFDGYLNLKKAFPNIPIDTLYINLDIETCIQRLKKRDAPIDEIQRRIENYKNDDVYSYQAKCDFVIDNSCEFNQTQLQIQKLINNLNKKYTFIQQSKD